MANRWGKNGNSDGLYFLRPQNAVDGDCSYEIKRFLLHGRKVMTKLDSVLKSRDITLLTKVCRSGLPFPAAAVKSRESCPTLCDPIEGSPQAPPSLGFSRQEHWSGLPFPSPMHESEK